jgi:hypothetical protein
MKKKFSKTISYKIAIYGIVTLFLFTCSCSEISDKNKQQEVKNPIQKHLIIKKPGSSFGDTIIINTKSAVFYSPDSEQMVKIKEINEKNIFDMITHDCHYQMQNARTVLEKYWHQIRIIDVSKARYLLFVKENKSKIYIDLNDKNDICGLFLFDRKKDPVFTDMPNINTQLGFYFSQ